jgi:hypothetical protein
LSGKSKEVSEFSDATLQVGKTVHEIRHANYSMREGCRKANGGKRGEVREVRCEK